MKGYTFYIIGLLFFVYNPLSAQENNGDKEKTSDSTEIFLDQKIDGYEYDFPERDLQSNYTPWQEKYIGKIVFSNYLIPKDTIDETKLKDSFYGDEEITMRYFCKKEFTCGWGNDVSVKIFIDGKWINNKNMFNASGLFRSGCNTYTASQTIQSANHKPNNVLSKDVLVHFKGLSIGNHIVKIQIGCDEPGIIDGKMIPEASGQFELIITREHMPTAHKNWNEVMPFNTLPHLQKGIEKMYGYDKNPNYTFYDTVFQTVVKEYVAKQWKDVEVLALKSGMWWNVKSNDDPFWAKSRQVYLFALVKQKDGLCYVRTTKYYADRDPDTGEFKTKGYLNKEEKFTEERIDCPTIY